MKHYDLSAPYFVGIGGVGMGALARILLADGQRVSGSDRQDSPALHQLKELGAQVFVGHNAENIDHVKPSVLVVSQAAIAHDNPELVRAQSLGIDIIYRSDLLARMTGEGRTIAVAGTHGKTSTTAMLVTMLHAIGVDASYAVGGHIINLGAGGYGGTSDIFVFEADESDGSLTKYHPHAAIITNVDPDHLDHFGSPEEYYHNFVDFLDHIPRGGIVAICVDSPLSKRLYTEKNDELVARGVDVYPYSVHSFTTAPIIAEGKNILDDEHNTPHQAPEKTRSHQKKTGSFLISPPQSGKACTVNILGETVPCDFSISGMHMVSNAMGALTVAAALGFPQSQLAEGLRHFQGTHRRFELRATISGIKIIDDYAHHPTEISAVLEGARQTYPHAKIMVIFQPHMYSRTRDFAPEFAEALNKADKAWVVDIYPAREEPIPGVSSQRITEKAHSHVVFTPDMKEAARQAVHTAQSGDIIITMGAGTITQLAGDIEKIIQQT